MDKLQIVVKIFPGVDPMNVLHMPEPAQLALGESSRIPLEQLDGFLLRRPASQPGNELLVSQPLHGHGVLRHALLQQAGDLLRQPGLHHEIDSLLDSAVQLRTVHLQSQNNQFVGRLFFLSGELAAHRLPRHMDNFQRPDDSSHIVGMQLGRGLGIGGSQPGMQGIDAIGIRELLELRTEGFVRARLGEPVSVADRLDVESGAADNEWKLAAGCDLRNEAAARFLEVGGRVGLVRIPDIDEMVGNPLHLITGNFGRADVHSPVDLHGVSRDDFRVPCLGKLQAQLRLADGRRPDQNEKRLFSQFESLRIRQRMSFSPDSARSRAAETPGCCFFP
ncbi:hypothetical protein BN871_CL_00640 [Paenibacillus sp. P22]|nr:hypothetical protein BN871_CL_00640 [Paenibacillus sp. P22]